MNFFRYDPSKTVGVAAEAQVSEFLIGDRYWAFTNACGIGNDYEIPHLIQNDLNIL